MSENASNIGEVYINVEQKPSAKIGEVFVKVEAKDSDPSDLAKRIINALSGENQKTAAEETAKLLAARKAKEAKIAAEKDKDTKVAMATAMGFGAGVFRKQQETNVEEIEVLKAYLSGFYAGLSD